MPLRELDILAMVRTSLPGGGGLTDDCGELVPPAGGRLLATTDLMEEGIHFRREWHPPRLLGRKLLTVNLSDLDASGAVPIGFTLTLALPADIEDKWLGEILGGLAEVAREQRVSVIGGDTVGRTAGVGLGVTAFGTAQRWLTRDRVEAGDHLYVDQPLGLSRRGLLRLQQGQRWDASCPHPELSAHLDPRPNLGLGPRLAALPEVHACIDLSDGLGMDLQRLAEASACSILLEDDLTREEIEGGEDYARCFATPLPGPALEARLGVALRRVGVAVESRGEPLWAVRDGIPEPLPGFGFDHFRP